MDVAEEYIEFTSNECTNPECTHLFSNKSKASRFCRICGTKREILHAEGEPAPCTDESMGESVTPLPPAPPDLQHQYVR
jgi:hypothetical protein